MAGQPTISALPWLSFNVYDLQVTEHPTEWRPSIIINRERAFRLSVTFTGDGVIWLWLRNLRARYEVAYYVEGIGVHADERDLGFISGTLEPGVDIYDYSRTALTVARGRLDAGVYKIAAIVRFPDAPGLTGFEDQMAQVY